MKVSSLVVSPIFEFEEAATAKRKRQCVTCVLVKHNERVVVVPSSSQQ